MFAKYNSLFLLLLLFLTACGGGGSGDGAPADAVVTGLTDFSGVFSGSVVSGVHYRASLDEISREGETGADGTFSYFSRDGVVASTVTFSIGEMILGHHQPLPVEGQGVTVFDLVDASDPEAEDKAINLYRFLRSLAGTEAAGDIQITPLMHRNLSGVGEKNLAEITPTSFDEVLRDVGVATLLSREAVLSHVLKTKLQEDAVRIKTLKVVLGAETAQADGVHKILLKAEVKAVNNKPVRGVRVQFQTTAGSFSDKTQQSLAARLTDTAGQASVFLTAPLQPLAATLSVAAGGWTEIREVAFVAPEPPITGEPSEPLRSIQVFSGEKHLFVKGVGAVEQTQITLSVLDASGNPLNETASGYAQDTNNLRVTFQAHPGGGEVLSGLRRKAGALSGADMERVHDSQTIEVRTTMGEAVVDLMAGHRPGTVLLAVELLATDAVTVLASASSTPVSIASGPADTIVLTRSSGDLPVNLGTFGLSGVYCQMGSVLVTDRYGNAVPDGTPVSLGLVDTVIHEGSAVITKDSENLMLLSPEGGFDASFALAVTEVNGASRQIQSGDRILIPTEVASTDRSRFVMAVGHDTQLVAASTYLSRVDDPESQNVRYLVGASLRGGAIHGYTEVAQPPGCDPVKLTTGRTLTVGGVAPIRVTYPASKETISVGCFEDPAVDGRHTNARSAQVLALASTNDGSTTAIDQGGFCFRPVTPNQLTVVRDVLMEGAALVFTLEDAHGIRLPFVPVHCVVTFSGATPKKLAHPGATNQDGQAFLYDKDLVEEGKGAGAFAAVVCQAQDASAVSMDVQIP